MPITQHTKIYEVRDENVARLHHQLDVIGRKANTSTERSVRSHAEKKV